MRKLLLLFLWLAAHVHAADIIPANRLTNWQGNVGVQATAGPYYSETFIPTRPTPSGTPIPASASVGTINQSIQACPSGQHVKLAAGTFNLAGKIVLKSGVTLRGSGSFLDPLPSRTILNFTALGSSGQLGGTYIQVEGTGYGNGQPSIPFVTAWTGGYSTGTTSITVTSAANFNIGDLVVLDQLDDSNYIGNGSTNAGNDHGTTLTGQAGRHQHEVHEITNISGSTFTISPGVYMPNYSAGFSPNVWKLTNSKISWVGIEDLVVDGQTLSTISSPNLHNISFWYAQNCWVMNVETTYGHAQNIGLRSSKNIEIRHSFIREGSGSGSGNYGIEAWMITQALIEDNALARISSQIILNESMGCVIAYNYITGAVWFNAEHLPQMLNANHNAHPAFNLYEGNICPKYMADYIHGSGSHQTVFRNRFQGWETGRTSYTHPICLEWYNRYYNVVGNVLGTTGYHTTYEIRGPAGLVNEAIYMLGYYNITGGGPSGPPPGAPAGDDLVWTTLIRHGNYDVVTDAADGAGNGIVWQTTNANGVDPTNHTIPISLYRASKPLWFGNLSWPPIDPASPGTIVPSSIPSGYRYANGTEPPTGPTPTPTPTPTPGAPAISSHPSSISIMEGQTPTFAVAIASGAGQVTYQWQKNTVNVGTPTTTGATSDVYFAPAATLADSGSNFRCVVSNATGSVTSNAAILTVTTSCPAGITHAVGTWSALEGDITPPFNVTDAAEDYISQNVETTTDPLQGGKARYCVTIPNPPNADGYTVSMKVKCADLGSDSLFVGFDGEPNVNTGKWANIPQTSGLEFREVFFAPPGPSGNPYVWKPTTAGNHQIIVRGREADVWISQLKVEAIVGPTPTPTPSPTPAAAIPTFNPNGANAITSQVITMDSATRTGSPVIKFTINGIDPAVADPGDIITYNGTSYTADHTLTINARTSATGFVDSPLATSQPYNITVATPSASPGAGTYTGMTTQTLTCTTPNSVWFYSTDGSNPSVPYGVPVVINTTCTFKYRATKVGLIDSAVGSSAIVINNPTPTPTPTPTATPTPTPTVTPFPPTGPEWID